MPLTTLNTQKFPSGPRVKLSPQSIYEITSNKFVGLHRSPLRSPSSLFEFRRDPPEATLCVAKEDLFLIDFATAEQGRNILRA